MKINRLYFLILIVFCSVFFITQKAFAMPIGTLLYRTSADGQMYGYNTNKLLDFPNVNSGHVGIYAGQDEKSGEHMVLEAVNNGVQLTLAKYFVNKDKGEKLVGAKIPEKLTLEKEEFLKQIIQFLGSQNLAYDFDFQYQKGPDSGQWICVGLTEKIYESLNFGKEFEYLSQLEYNPDNYYIDITKDGYDSNSFYNFEKNDYFSTTHEYSKIGKRYLMGEVVGYTLGRVEKEERYFFLPYTQFLQIGLVDVEVDILLESSFEDEKVRGKMPGGKILVRMIINNARSSTKITVDRTKRFALKIRDLLFNKEDNDTRLAQRQINAGFVMPAEDNEVVKEIKFEDLIPSSVLASESEANEEPKRIKDPSLALRMTKNEEMTKNEVATVEEKLEISYVIDGDTFTLSTGEKVRYIGIDTPELGKEGSEDDECLAWEARLRNMELLSNGELKLTKDKNVDKDMYGRLLRYVYVNNIFINEVLVKEGLAQTFFCGENWENCPETKNIEEKQLILNANKYAKDNNLGLFSDICKKEIVLATTTKKIVENKKEEEKVVLEIKQQLPLFHTGGGSSVEVEEEIVVEIGTTTATTTEEEATTTEEEATTTEEVLKVLLSEFTARGSSGNARDEFVELYNPSSENINLLNWRLQYKSANGDTWKNKTGTDGLPEIIISPQKYLLLSGKGYIGSTIPDYQHNASWSFADGGGHIRIVDNLENEIDKIGYGIASDPEMEAIEIDFSENGSLERKALATSTELTMIMGGEHWTLGNANDSDNNKNDFIVRAMPDPQNSSSEKEPRESLLIQGEEIDNLSIIGSSTTASSIEISWNTPKFANLGNNSVYDLRYIEKEGDCDMENNWDLATSVSVDLLPIPTTTIEVVETLEINNLLPNTEYCLAIKTYNSQKWSKISNILEIKTSDIEKESENLENIEIGNYNQHSGIFISALAWKHEIKEGSDLLIVPVFMHYWKDFVTKILFGNEEMELLSKSEKLGGINYEIFYLINPPVGESVIYLEMNRENAINGFSIDFSGIDIDNFPILALSKLTKDKKITTKIENEYQNSLAVEVLMINNWVDIPSPESGQNILIRKRMNYDNYGWNSFSILSIKELELGDNELSWQRTLNQVASQDVILLKPE